VLDGAQEIDAVRQSIERICRQPKIDYPIVTGEWPLIRRRSDAP